MKASAGQQPTARGSRLPGTTRTGLGKASWAVFWVGLLVACAVRWLTVDVRILNVDEASYAAAAVRALDTGTIVLKASRDNKPPGIVAVYAAVFKVFGWYDMPAIRMLALACVAGTGGLLFVYCRRWLSAQAGAAAAGFYWLASSLDLRFLAFKTELLMNLALCAAVCLSVDASMVTEPAGRRRRLQLVVAGLCLALAMVTRQTAALIFAGFWLGLLAALWRPLPLASFAKDVLTASLGAALGLGVMAALYLQADAWTELWRQMVEFPRDFAGTQRFSLAQRAVRLVTYLEEYFGYAQILFALALYGLIAGLASLHRESDSDGAAGRREKLLTRAAAAGLGAAVVAFAAAPDMFHAYFLQLYVPLSFGLALCMHRHLRLAAHGQATPLLVTLVALALLSGSVAALKEPVKHARGQVHLDQRHPFDSVLRSRAAPGDRLFVWGYRPQFYLNSGLAPATRFTLTDHLIGIDANIGKRLVPDRPYPYYEPDGWRHFLAELDEERPRFIVETPHVAISDDEVPIKNYPALHRLLLQKYQLIASTPHQLKLYERLPTRP